MKGLFKSEQFQDLAMQDCAVLFEKLVSMPVIEKDALALNINLCRRENLHIDAEKCQALLIGLLKLAKENHRFVRVDYVDTYAKKMVSAAYRDDTVKAIKANRKILVKGVAYYAI